MDLTEQEREAVRQYLEHVKATRHPFSREPEPRQIQIALIGDSLVGHLRIIHRLMGAPAPEPDYWNPFQDETIDLIYNFEVHRFRVQFVDPHVMPSWTEDGWEGDTNLVAIRYALRSEATVFVYLPTRKKTLGSLERAWQAWNKLLAGEMAEQLNRLGLLNRSRTLFVVAHDIEEENGECTDLLEQGQAFSQQLGASFMRMKMDDFEQGKVDLHAILSRILYQRAVDHGFTQNPTETRQEEEAQQARAQRLFSRLRKVVLGNRRRSRSHPNTS